MCALAARGRPVLRALLGIRRTVRRIACSALLALRNVGGGGYVMEARGNVDNDSAIDLWLVSSGTVQVTGDGCSQGDHAVAGTMASLYDDVSCP